MKKQLTPAQIQAEKFKNDLTDRLTDQIKSLGQSGLFEMYDLFEIVQNTIQKKLDALILKSLKQNAKM